MDRRCGNFDELSQDRGNQKATALDGRRGCILQPKGQRVRLQSGVNPASAGGGELAERKILDSWETGAFI